MARPATKVQLSISCSNLANKDLLSKSDPQVFVHLRTGNGAWMPLGKTEVVWDDLNPKFQNKIEVDYYFEEAQHLKFTVVDVDNGKGEGRIEDQDFLGTLETQLSQIFTSRGQTLEQDLRDTSGKHPTKGKIKVIAEELKDNQEEVTLSCSAHHLDSKDFFGFGKSDPYYVISKATPSGQWVVVYKSEHLNSTLNPVWKPVKIKMRDLNNGDLERKLLVQVFDWNKVQTHELIGQFETTMAEILEGKPNDFFLVNPELKEKKKKYKNSGSFVFTDHQVVSKSSFLEFISAGLDINLAVAIDFTQSNGDPQKADSLHYLDPNPVFLNQYQQAISGVGSILEAYDSDKKFPVFGFGAKFMDGSVSHCFPLNGNPEDPEVFGVAGIQGVYVHSLRNIQLWGPTNFAPILRITRSVIEASQSTGSIKYFILMIITDGVITDIDDTIREIVGLSSLPLSIVIVGVGLADFTNMKILDGDENRLSWNGRTAERDIVQFVPYLDCKDPYILARETLAEIPDQLTDYMLSKGITPQHIRGRH